MYSDGSSEEILSSVLINPTAPVGKGARHHHTQLVLAATPFTHTVKDGVLKLTGESPPFPRLGNSDVDQEITVPPGSRFESTSAPGTFAPPA